MNQIRNFSIIAHPCTKAALRTGQVSTVIFGVFEYE